ncbi:MAG: bifunctional fucokinase/L-fucose-1-P-guanylyltransferase, partial [Lachnospiraceae bacterium]|nr:bifunctional fucokinase/L-fucose-1-P-guanylyltransferase [Lachnospiraceae bacterium]
NEHGGMVLNAAIRLNGILPAQAVISRLESYHIELESADLGVYTVIRNLSELQDCMDPYDNFALHKAALLACGLIPTREEMAGEDVKLEDLLGRLGGGIYLATKVVGVPKGSGLGTSSILAGACAKAIAEFTGAEVTRGMLFDQVLYMEQLMSTGGGWQDQAGGIVPGIKMITSKPGARQILEVEPVRMDEKTKEELNRRFAIIYTGQRRLARNLLREVVGNYIGGREESVQALEQMKQTALLMKQALEKGDVDELAELFNHHWKLSLQLDAGATNPGIDQIFEAIEDLIDGKFIAGAGGGGFLQIIMKKDVSADQVDQRLKETFPETGIALWKSELYFG